MSISIRVHIIVQYVRIPPQPQQPRFIAFNLQILQNIAQYISFSPRSRDTTPFTLTFTFTAFCNKILTLYLV